MITVGKSGLSVKHSQVKLLIEFLHKEYTMPSATVNILYDYEKEFYIKHSNKVTGLISVEGSYASINVAAKNRSPRAVALTTAHEYMHCIQFTVRGWYMNRSNREALENEAITFAEDVLTRLWKEQQVFYPSRL